MELKLTWNHRLPPLLAGSNSWNTTTGADEPLTLLYRSYATLYFIIIADSLESPLGLLDLLHVFVRGTTLSSAFMHPPPLLSTPTLLSTPNAPKALDQLFENVCELDLIFNFETLHATLEEIIVGGCVVETDLNRVVSCVREAGKVAKRPRGGGGGGGSGSGMGLNIGMGRGGFMGSELVWTGR